MENEFFKVDLHIHTPASKCYKGQKNTNEYLRIVKAAKQKGIKIIAFTDHNSIDGYKTLQELRDNLENQKATFLLIKDSEQSKKEIKKIDNILKSLQNVLILPGVEFEVSNAVHFLVIFDNKTPVKQIEKFLRDGGYDEEQFGSDQPTKCSSFDIIHFYEELKKFNCIVICSHFDSDKGVYNVIPASTLRAKCLSSEQLNGIEYKSEVTKDKIANIIRTSKEYLRKLPMAFVKFSDAHDVSEVGRNVTYIKLGKIDFNSLKKAFGNAAESVSTEYPEIKSILDKLIFNELSFGVENLLGDNKRYFQELICGLYNSEGGYCLLGINSDNNKIGLNLVGNKKNEINAAIKKHFDEINTCINELDVDIELSGTVYPLLGKKFIISLQIKKGDKFAHLKNDNNVYIIKDKKLTLLTLKELQKIIENRTISFVEARLESKITRIEGQVNSIRSFLKIIPVLHKIENTCIPLNEIISKPAVIGKMKLSIRDMGKIKELEKAHPNGVSKGDILLLDEITSPRLSDAYLRFSPPILNLGLSNKLLDKKETIYLVPGGGVFFGEKSYPMFTKSPVDFMVTFLSKNPMEYSNKFIASFLKSSVWLSYCINKLGTLDNFMPDIFKEALIPRININNPEKKSKIDEIERNFDKILSLEKQFCSKKFRHVNKDIYLQVVNSHNMQVGKFAYEIDLLIYSLINLSNNEVEVIEASLRHNRIFLPLKK